jgi:hypothetical protein
VKFVVDKVALEKDFFPSLFGFSLPVTIPSWLHTDLSLSLEVCNSCDQAAHYHISDFRLGTTSLALHLPGYKIRKYYKELH